MFDDKRKVWFMQGLAAAGLLFLVIAAWPVVLRIIAGTTVIGCWFGSRVVQKKMLNEDVRVTWEEEQAKLAESVRHYRHDMLNHFQVLLCYFQLNRMEKGQEYIQTVHTIMQKESALSKLGYAPLVAYLLSFNALHKELYLTVHVQEDLDLNQLPVSGRHVYEQITTMVGLYDRHSISKIAEPNEIVLDIAWHEEMLHISFEFYGELDRTSMKKEMAVLTHDMDGISESYMQKKHQSLIQLASSHVS